jgi:pyrroloquinoline-quinone synthase
MAGTDALRERLLSILERKNHWAWPHFAEGRVPFARLLPHFRLEWEVYVRDFPILLARVLGHAPPAPVAADLAANIYEEQTGGISGSKAHPELFLNMMAACGFERSAFENVQLPPRARAYREFLDEVSWGKPWIVGAAVLTLWVEGSVNERKELAKLDEAPMTDAEIDEAVRRHPLVKFHNVDPKALELVRVHKKVEGGHREDAWSMVMNHVTPESQPRVEAAMLKALELWLGYRDEVAEECGIGRA